MEEVTEYERKRQENVMRNAAMIAALGVRSAVQDLRSAHESRKEKGFKASATVKRERTEPIVLRRSLRFKGISPDNKQNFGRDFDEGSNSPSSERSLDLNQTTADVSLSSVKVNQCKPSADTSLFNRIIRLQQSQDESSTADVFLPDPCSRLQAAGCDLHSPDSPRLRLQSKDVARLVPERIFNVLFLPSKEITVIAAGDKTGHIGLWDADCDTEEGDGVYTYRPHTAPVSSIASNEYDITKLLSCSYDGCVRMMDIGKDLFSVVNSTGEVLTALCYSPSSSSLVCLGDDNGYLRCLDIRDGKISCLLSLHNQRVNSIQFNPEKGHLMLTSATDGKACIWDVRNLKQASLKPLCEWKHPRAVQSAYFSPSGNHVASTCYDNYIRVWTASSKNSLTGKNGDSSYPDEPVKIFHNNQTNRWLSTFRAIWGWNDSFLFLGNMSRAVDVISINGKSVIDSMRSEFMTSIPCRFACHSRLPGLVAGGTAGGKVYLWRK